MRWGGEGDKRTAQEHHERPRINNRLGQKPGIIAVLSARNQMRVHREYSFICIVKGEDGCEESEWKEVKLRLRRNAEKNR